MKLFITLFALIAVSTADVSHLNREYLPPHDAGHQHVEAHHHAEYVQQVPEAPADHTSHGVISQKVTSVYGVGQAAAYAEGQIVNRYGSEEQQDVPAAIGADSYTPAHLAEEHHHHEEHQAYQDVPLPIGADTYTPAQYGEDNQNIPGGSADSYTPAHLLEEHHHHEEQHHHEEHQDHQDIPLPIGADTYTPAQYGEDNQNIPGATADSYTPAHLIEQHQEAESGAQEFDISNHSPVVVYGDLPSQPDSPQQYQTQQESHVYEDVSNAIDTKYGSNGGYIY